MFNEERAQKLFKNHVATLTDYGNIKILDFKNPESCDYRIRFLFEEDYYRLHISGDLGELTATNCSNMTYEAFSDFVRDADYFKKKVNCHSKPFYYYNEESIRSDVLKLITENFELEDFIENIRGDEFCSNEEVLDDFFSKLLTDFSYDKGLTFTAHKLLEKALFPVQNYSVTSYCRLRLAALDEEIGKRTTEYLNMYLLAFKLAKKQIDDSIDI